MFGFSTQIEEDALANNNVQRLLLTAPLSQMVLMTLQPRDEIGVETHVDRDQILRVEMGVGDAVVNGEHHSMSPGTVVLILAGSEHRVINISATAPLRFYSMYSPVEHPDRTSTRRK
jgi:mannose-6-phosphate isomerase-like protein (cupin superfamily)